MQDTSEPTTTINVPYPDTADLHLRISVGACRLKIAPAAEGGPFVSGTYSDPSHAVPLRVDQEGANVRISQSFVWPDNLVIREPARLELAIGKARPFELVFEMGANEGSADLGGLPLTRLNIKYGAGKQVIDFSTANPQAMDSLSVSAGAADLELKHLANANFAEMYLEGGAAAFHLDFGGRLARDARARLTTGMAAVDLAFPSTSAARITTETTLGSVEVGNGFTKQEGAFWTAAAVAGQTPALTVRASVAMGSIRLKTG